MAPHPAVLAVLMIASDDNTRDVAAGHEDLPAMLPNRTLKCYMRVRERRLLHGCTTRGRLLTAAHCRVLDGYAAAGFVRAQRMVPVRSRPCC